MSILKRASGLILGLFVDDGALALWVIVVVALAGWVSLMDAPARYVGALLFLGLPAVLCATVWRATRRCRTSVNRAIDAMHDAVKTSN